MELQKTVRRPVHLEGVGLHRGRTARLTVEPAGADTGLVFVRADLDGAEVPALQQFRAGMIHASSLARGATRVETPEHLLAALYALGVDNARLVLEGPEVPILDGSALPFARALLAAGCVEQDRPRRKMVVTRPVVVGDEERRIEVHPGPGGLVLTAGIDFDDEQVGFQELTVRLDRETDFLAKLAPARTFGLLRDIERLRQAGLARGGSTENAIVVGEGGILGGPLRFPDEFVRHKLLDLVGDLALLGCRLEARLLAWRSGHDLHGRLVDALLAHRDAVVLEGDWTSPAPRAQPAAPGRTSP